jgi:Zn-finger nucleic acid-binding protein
MEAVVIGKSRMRECPKCEGIWVDADSLHEICEDREDQAAVLGMASHLPAAESPDITKVQYLPCPVCKELMNRVNFANCSHVIVDVCQKHGTWFDHDDLRHMVEFIQAGGMAQSRQREIADLEAERRRLEWQSTSFGAGSGLGSTGFGGRGSGSNYDWWQIGIGAAAVLLRMLIR